jgi:pyruvate dehydrogenase E2 component (dihydrolipoamide acetyltransferase)
VTTTVVEVPDVGDFEGIPVIEILVSPGERVEAEQALITLESDKATMDVPAPYAGIVGAILVALGDSVSQGSALLELNVEQDVGDATPALPEQSAVTRSQETAKPARDVEGTPPVRRTVEPTLTPLPLPTAPRNEGSARSHASPTVRRFARVLGVNLAEVAGMGAKGRILREDVESHVKTRLTQISTDTQRPSDEREIPSIPTVDFAKFGPVETRPLSRIKRISGTFLQRAWLNIPHVTYQEEADITRLEAFRQSLKADPQAKGVRITPLPFFIKALCASLREFPVLNSSLSSDGQSLIYKGYFHIGVAVDTPHGLVVPVVRDADTKGIIELSTELATVSSRARDGKLAPADLQGGCMSISSLGGIGGTGFTPLINAPEVAILGVARSRMTPVWNGEEFVPRLLLPLCLSFDHRVVDGAEAARFMSFLAAQLSDVRKLLL